VFRSKEYSPEEMASFEENQVREGFAAPTRTREEFAARGHSQVMLGGGLLLVRGGVQRLAREPGHLPGDDPVGGNRRGRRAPHHRWRAPAAGPLPQRLRHDPQRLPRHAEDDAPAAWAQFFSWFALFAMWIYTTAAVTSHLYHTTDTTSALYNEGANWVGVGFGAYNGVAALVAFGIPPLARWSSPRIAHVICLLCGAIGLISVYFLSDPRFLLGSMVGIGIAWASILAMPYAILTGSLPPSKLGYYMASSISSSSSRRSSRPPCWLHRRALLRRARDLRAPDRRRLLHCGGRAHAPGTG
jgi:maltose/moltooligosaccharide transporter